MSKLRIASAAVAGIAGLGVAVAPVQAAPVGAQGAKTLQAAPAAAQGVGVKVKKRDYNYCVHLYGNRKLVATGCFASKGDKIWVKDQRADGLRAVVTWKTSYGRSGACHQKGGGGAAGYCNYNMAENRSVKFRVSVRNGQNGKDRYSSGYTKWLPIGGVK